MCFDYTDEGPAARVGDSNIQHPPKRVEIRANVVEVGEERRQVAAKFANRITVFPGAEEFAGFEFVGFEAIVMEAGLEATTFGAVDVGDEDSEEVVLVIVEMLIRDGTAV